MLISGAIPTNGTTTAGFTQGAVQAIINTGTVASFVSVGATGVTFANNTANQSLDLIDNGSGGGTYVVTTGALTAGAIRLYTVTTGATTFTTVTQVATQLPVGQAMIQADSAEGVTVTTLNAFTSTNQDTLNNIRGALVAATGLTWTQLKAPSSAQKFMLGNGTNSVSGGVLAGSWSVTGLTVSAGGILVSGGITVSTGNLVVTVGSLTLTAGSLTVTAGNVSLSNTGGTSIGNSSWFINNAGTASFASMSTGALNATGLASFSGHVVSTGTAPTLTNGAALGTAPTSSIVGTDISGEINLTYGSSPPAGGVLVTVTFHTAYSAIPNVTLTLVTNVPATTPAILYLANITNAVFTIGVQYGTTSALVGNSFSISYHVIG